MTTNTRQVSEAFSKQSGIFDDLYQENKLSEYLRSLFRQEVLSHLKPGSEILELNCGTGLDALLFAEKGHHVLATDNAPGMLAQLEKKLGSHPDEASVEPLRCSFHELQRLRGRTFDHIVSNFGGLNCTDRLDKVLEQFSALLKPGGKVTLMIMPKICPWELIMMFKGKFRTAFRRFGNGTPAKVEGVSFMCYYYDPSYVKRVLKKEFKTLSLKGIFITVPPEFYQNFVERYPKWFKVLTRIDAAISRTFPFTYCCDHYLITLEKKQAG